jgi:hypothetical protein
MDGRHFDTATRALARQTPRRLVLGGLLAAATALLTETDTRAVKPRRRRNRDGQGGDTDITLPPGTLTGGVWDESIEICHFDFGTGKYRIIAVPTPSVPNYLNQGHTLFIDCCVDTDCALRTCLIATGCIEGACAYDTTEGAACQTGEGVSGYCDDRARCVPYTPPTTTTVVTPMG